MLIASQTSASQRPLPAFLSFVQQPQTPAGPSSRPHSDLRERPQATPWPSGTGVGVADGVGAGVGVATTVGAAGSSLPQALSAVIRINTRTPGFLFKLDSPSAAQCSRAV